MITPAEMIAIRALTDLLGYARGSVDLLASSSGLFAQHLDEAPQGQRRDHVLGLAPLETQERRAKADRELLDLHAVPLGHQEVAQLVDEDHQAQSQGDLHAIVQQRSGSPTLNLPSCPRINIPELFERRRRIKRMMFERRAAGRGDVQKADLSLQEPRHRRLVGRVEHRAGRSPRRITSKPSSRPGNVSQSGGSKVQAQRLSSRSSRGQGAATRSG